MDGAFCVCCMYLSNKSCRNWRPCGKVRSSSPDSTPIIVFCSSVTPTMRATCNDKSVSVGIYVILYLILTDLIKILRVCLVHLATWQSTLSMCRAVVSAFDRLKSSFRASRTLGSRGRLFCGNSTDSNSSSWKHDFSSICDKKDFRKH